MTLIEHIAYPRLKRTLTPKELDQIYTPTLAERLGATDEDTPFFFLSLPTTFSYTPLWVPSCSVVSNSVLYSGFALS